MIRLISLLNEGVANADSIQWAQQFKRDLGLTDEAAAAMAANIQHESGFMPDRIQGAGIKRGTLADSGNLGYSWAQWTFGPRKQSFRNYILKKYNIDINKTPAKASHAYDFLKHEIKNYPGFDFNSFRNSNDVNSATADFVTNYEQAGKPMLAQREQIAQDILTNLKSKQPATNQPEIWKTALNKVTDSAMQSVKQHVVKPGENLSTIASKYKIPMWKIVSLNPGIDMNKIQPDQKINIRP